MEIHSGQGSQFSRNLCLNGFDLDMFTSESDTEKAAPSEYDKKQLITFAPDSRERGGIKF